MYLGAGSQPQASVSCRAIHSAVGCAVTPSHNIWRRPCRRINKPYSSRNEIVGTTNRSIDAIPSAWLRRNVFQPWDGGLLRLAMYLATEVWPTSMPSLRSSPWILGAPQSGLGSCLGSGGESRAGPLACRRDISTSIARTIENRLDANG